MKCCIPIRDSYYYEGDDNLKIRHESQSILYIFFHYKSVTYFRGFKKYINKQNQKNSHSLIRQRGTLYYSHSIFLVHHYWAYFYGRIIVPLTTNFATRLTMATYKYEWEWHVPPLNKSFRSLLCGSAILLLLLSQDRHI